MVLRNFEVMVAGWIFLLLCLPRPAAGEVWFSRCLYQSHLRCRDNNLIKPRTRHGVIRAYQWFVRTGDGVSETEAKIMAQYEVVKKRIEHDFHLAKPKILSQTQGQWIVRLPGKFSLTKGRANMYVVCIDQKDGEVTCSKIEEQNED